MAMASERSKHLHNFSLPQLKWGSQRFLRCTKLSSIAADSSSPSDSKSFQFREKIVNSISNPNNQNRRPESITPNDGSEELLTAASIREEGGCEEELVVARPWNLRTRRAACKAPQEEKKTNFCLSPLKGEKRKEMARGITKFSVSLFKGEVEEDFMAMVGRRPPRRPKKRPKIVQEKLDSIFPGLWLSEVTLDSYKER